MSRNERGSDDVGHLIKSLDGLQNLRPAPGPSPNSATGQAQDTVGGAGQTDVTPPNDTGDK